MFVGERETKDSHYYEKLLIFNCDLSQKKKLPIRFLYFFIVKINIF
jgi:hypothetical protein